MGTVRSLLREQIIDGWGSTAMDQNAFTPPTIVDLAEVAILLGFHALAQLLMDAAYALANEDIKLEKVETAFKELSRALLLIRGPEASVKQSQLLRDRKANQSDNSAASGMMAEAERRLRMEIRAARQPIF